MDDYSDKTEVCFIPLGKEFTYKGHTLITKESDSASCDGCAFSDKTKTLKELDCNAHFFQCGKLNRSDRKQVLFVLKGA